MAVGCPSFGVLRRCPSRFLCYLGLSLGNSRFEQFAHESGGERALGIEVERGLRLVVPGKIVGEHGQCCATEWKV